MAPTDSPADSPIQYSRVEQGIGHFNNGLKIIVSHVPLVNLMPKPKNLVNISMFNPIAKPIFV